MNNTITSTVLTDGTKIATAVPVDKKTDDKYFAINFRPVILLNCFSKVYENHIKKQLVHSMSNHMFPFVSANRKGYSSQHVLIRLLEEWREHLDNNNMVWVISWT